MKKGPRSSRNWLILPLSFFLSSTSAGMSLDKNDIDFLCLQRRKKYAEERDGRHVARKRERQRLSTRGGNEAEEKIGNFRVFMVQLRVPSVGEGARAPCNVFLTFMRWFDVEGLPIRGIKLFVCYYRCFVSFSILFFLFVLSCPLWVHFLSARKYLEENLHRE